MISYILFLLIIGFTLVFNYRRNYHVGYPPFLYSLIWFIAVFFHFICIAFDIIPLYKLTFESLFIYTVGVLVFTIGGAFAKKNDIQVSTENEDLHFFKVRTNFDLILIILSVLFLFFFAIASYQLALEYMIFDSLYAGLRNAAMQNEDVGISKYGINVAYVSFFVQVYQYIINKDNKWRLIWSVVILLLFCVIATGRTFFVILLCLIFGSLLVFNRLRFKYVLYAGLGFFGLFSIIAIVLNKGGSVDNNLSQNVEGIFESFLIYFVGSLSAFDTFIHSNYINTYGENTFRFVNSFINKFGETSVKVTNLVDEYVNVPFETNVYTIYKIYFQDFGMIFMIFVLLLISYFHSYLYYSAMKIKKFSYVFLYSVMLYPLVMSFFQEQYFSLFPTWMYMIILLLLIKPFIQEKRIT